MTDQTALERELEDVNEREQELLAQLAIARNPELKQTLSALQTIIDQIKGLDTQLKTGETKTTRKKRDSLLKKKGTLEAKLDEIDQELSGLDPSNQILTLEQEKLTLLEGLKHELSKAAPAFSQANVVLYSALPDLKKLEKDLDDM